MQRLETASRRHDPMPSSIISCQAQGGHDVLPCRAGRETVSDIASRHVDSALSTRGSDESSSVATTTQAAFNHILLNKSTSE
jgi:hypothetical protein